MMDDSASLPSFVLEKVAMKTGKATGTGDGDFP
jgi:hypothetical protein